MKIGEFNTSLRRAHEFYSELGLALPLVGPVSLPVHQEFNAIALDVERPYPETYFKGLQLGHYNFKLSDHSFFHFSYGSGDDLRYAFYPSPFATVALSLLKELEAALGARAENSELLVNFAAGAEVNSSRPLLRYEYNTDQFRPGLHPVSHLHIGTYGDDRWPLKPRLTPLAFAMLVAKLYFRPHWEAVTVGEDKDRKNEFDDRLCTERKVCTATPAEKFFVEELSFHLL